MELRQATVKQRMFSIDVFHYLFCRCFYSNQTLGKSKNQDNRVYINVSACEYYRELKRAKSKVINRTEQDGFVLTQTNVRSFTWIYGVRTESGLLTHFHIFNILGSTHQYILVDGGFFFRQHTVQMYVCSTMFTYVDDMFLSQASFTFKFSKQYACVCVNFI